MRGSETHRIGKGFKPLGGGLAAKGSTAEHVQTLEQNLFGGFQRCVGSQVWSRCLASGLWSRSLRLKVGSRTDKGLSFNKVPYCWAAVQSET